MARTGGPAFPRPASEYTAGGTLRDGNDAVKQQNGMYLRDYFAAAMVKCLSLDVVDRLVNPAGDVPLLDEVDDKNTYVVPETEVAKRLATAAYMLADAMLEARKQ